jgi:N-acetylglucosamine kinase-like BadF-type ATPase
LDEAVRVLYGQGVDRGRIAALAAIVADVGSRGDAVAQDILRVAGRDVGLAAATAAKRLGPGGPWVVSHQGALFAACPAFRETFDGVVRASCPRDALRPPVLPPLGGAFLEALDVCGGRATAGRILRFQREIAGCRSD